MWSKVLLCLFALSLFTATYVNAYEFHLLNGMVIKGDLKEFKDCRFGLTTDFGSVVIDAGKIDYIVVDKADGSAHPECKTPGVSVDGAGGEGRVGPEAVPSPPEAPQPLESVSVPPSPLEGWSLERQGGGQ